MLDKKNFYIITGGPGVGKTTLINDLVKRGYNCVPEVAREIIKNQVATGGNALPWGDTKEYSKRMLSYSIRDFKNLSQKEDLYFFDWGIPDSLGYERLMNFEPNIELLNAVNEYRYNKRVFILPPWKEIYKTDSERKQDFDVAVETYHVMKKTYNDMGYSSIDIPCLSIEKRSGYILQYIKRLSD